MGVRLDKPWRVLTAEAVADLPAELGVFQLGDSAGEVVRIGYAGGRTLFGLRSELEAALAKREAAMFRTEVTSQYMSRYEELLMVHAADHGQLPPGNAAEARRRLGRLSPG
ncbi:MAG TPA: hypothetical protein VLI41_01500 [Phenylobacterium sp.]|uniref:DUF7508 domain-containing protein n=1 Tax=Phenylobacterium sp. TaxID=1871053 RepID=UPI002CB58CD2|nr:hypothetical protein [Phenylobacterium sp.]HSV01854.1 hypothetical protein [Phenylobacterium sp.]